MPPIKEFLKYKTIRIPPMLLTQHKCRAIALFLRHLNPTITIAELEIDTRMKLGLQGEKKPTSKIFRKWMNKEGITDRKPKSKTN